MLFTSMMMNDDNHNNIDLDTVGIFVGKAKYNSKIGSFRCLLNTRGFT